jgi:hypothetical protein
MIKKISSLFESCCVLYTVYNSIMCSTFHEKCPDDDPAGSKHVANVHNKINTIQ